MSISDSITSLHGVGPKKAKALEKLKIRTVEDFLSYYPRDYQDRRHPKPIKELVEDETALICGKISLMVRGGYRGRKRTLKLLVTDETGGIEVIFFNASYLEKSFNRENEYEFYGKVTSRAGRLQMLHPEYNQKQPDEQGEILPVYPLTRESHKATYANGSVWR